MKELFIIKAGGSIITDKKQAEVLNNENIDTFIKQIVEIYNYDNTGIILGHGSGSFGHFYMKKYELRNKTHDYNVLGASVTKNKIHLLNNIVISKLTDQGIPVVSFDVEYDWFETRSLYSKQTIAYMLECVAAGIVPVVYGDFIFGNNRIASFSTEDSFECIVKELSENHQENIHLKRLIFCSDTDGVLDESGVVIPQISSLDFNKEVFYEDKKSFDVSGGMLGKVKSALKLSAYSDVSIINGKDGKSLIKVVNGYELGTTICKM